MSFFSIECPKPDGKFADQFDDAMYIVCKNGVPTKHNCPPYGYWDDKIKDCVIPRKEINTSTNKSMNVQLMNVCIIHVLIVEQ